MDEHEKRKVGQEVKQVQGRKVLQLPQEGGILQPDPAGLQLQQELLRPEDARRSGGGGASSLLVQEKQEQLLGKRKEKAKT